jgi:hypothetical protein
MRILAIAVSRVNGGINGVGILNSGVLALLPQLRDFQSEYLIKIA